MIEEDLREVSEYVKKVQNRAGDQYVSTICGGGGCCGDIDGALRIMGEELAEALFRLKELEK